MWDPSGDGNVLNLDYQCQYTDYDIILLFQEVLLLEEIR